MAEPTFLPYAESFPAYRYTALSHSRTIRLLHIYPNVFSEPLCCSLKEVPLDSNPQYDALSYAWGEPLFTESLLLIDKLSVLRLKITESLRDALLYIRREDEVMVIWVDAICINQDDLDERSSQVTSMGQIYRKASCVRIWLGLTDEASEIAFDWMARCYENAETIVFEDTGHNLAEFQYYMPVHQKPRLHTWPRFPAEVNCEECRSAIIETFSAHGKRMWWRRRWVMQELVSSQKALVMCGSQCIDWCILEQVAEVCYQIWANDRMSSDSETLAQILLEIWSFMTIRRSFESKSLPSIEYLLMSVSRLRVTDLRDNLYAVLSMCDTFSQIIRPDYRKDFVEVYIEGTLAILQDKPNLQAFSFARLVESNDPQVLKACEQQRDIPSWVIDIGCLKPHRIRPYFEQYFADQSSPCFYAAWNCCSMPAILLKGLQCDEVDFVGQDLVSLDDIQGTELDGFFEILLEFLRRTSSVDKYDFLRVILWDCEVNSEAYLPGHKRLTRATLEGWRNAYIGKFHDIAEGPVIQGVLETWRLKLDPFELPSIEEQTYKLGLIMFALAWAQTEKGWCLCLFKSGRIGWVPDKAESGDLVFILCGSRMPFVLRPVDIVPELEPSPDDCHVTIVGPAYVQGIMDGEAMAGIMAEDLSLVCLH